MRIGIKYCGGCNESYKRERIEEILKRELKNCQFFYSNNADLIVCISGCKKGCAAEKVSGNFVHFDEWVGEDKVLTKIKAKLSELLRS
ncbi:MAG: hypothetical protein LM574_01905 [Archaeoglobus sp.]|jgi:hypothetical protein|nr:hypothetical protein [Archaeoglobus sp.]